MKNRSNSRRLVGPGGRKFFSAEIRSFQEAGQERPRAVQRGPAVVISNLALFNDGTIYRRSQWTSG